MSSTIEPTTHGSGEADRQWRPAIVVVAGPTGIGKSSIAIALASHLGGEIVNFDSVQIYRGFDIGSAKPSSSERASVPHHLYDVADAEEEIHAAGFAEMARTTLSEIAGRGKLPILVGGTGFYLRALLSGLPPMPPRDEELRARLKRIGARAKGWERLHRLLGRLDAVSAARIAPADRHRIERALEVALVSGRPISSWSPPGRLKERGDFNTVHFAITMPRPSLIELLDRRVEQMYSEGLVEETRELLSRHRGTARPFQSIGYREAIAVIEGHLTEPEAIAETRRRTRAYAKRQMTWWRSEPAIHWIVRENDSSMAVAAILRRLQSESDWNDARR